MLFQLCGRSKRLDPATPGCSRTSAGPTGKPAKQSFAIEHLEKAIALKDDLQDARLALALLLMEDEQRLDEAIEHFERVLRAIDGGAFIISSMATALARRGDLAAAIAKFEAAAAIEPLAAAAHFEWGSALGQLRRYGEAERHFHTALENSPDSAQVLASLGLTSEAQGRRQEAVEYYRRSMAIETNPVAATRLHELGVAP